jgi:PAS domain S-box-containing protein
MPDEPAAPARQPETRGDHLGRLLRVIREINALVIRERNPQRMLDAACEILVHNGRYRLAWIGQTLPNVKGLQPVAHAGPGSEFLTRVGVAADQPGIDGGPIGPALHTRQTRVSPDVRGDPDHAAWREAAQANGAVAVAAIPMLQGQHTFGVLAVYADTPPAFHVEELGVLEELAGDLAFALRAIEDEGARKRSEARQQLLVSALKSAANAIVITDRTAAILWVNPAFTRLTGYALAECERRNMRLLKSGKHDRGFYARLWQTILAGRIWREQMYNRRKDGSLYLEENTITPVCNEAGEVEHFIAVKEDITQRSRAADALRRSEERLRLAVEAADMGMWDRDLKNDELYWSAEQERFMGYAPGTFPGTPEALLELLHPDSLAVHAAAQDRVRTGDGVFEAELRFRCRDGSDRWGYLRGRAVRDAAGDFDRIIGVTVDITRHKEAEQALRESEERFRTLFDYAPDACYLHDLQGTFVDGNLAAEQMIGYRREELIGKSFLDLNLLSAEDLPRAAATLRRCHQGEATGPEAFTLRRKDGRFVTAEMRTQPIKIGPQVLVLGLARDITERRRAEADLLQSEMQFRAMFELASVGMAQADVNTGQWLRVNQKMCEITGYAAEEMLQLRVSEITHEEDRQEDWEAFQRVVRGESPSYRLEKRYVRKDGAVIWVNVNMTVIRDPSGQPWRTMAAVEDISERRRLDEQLRKLARAVEQSPASIVITDRHGRIEFVNPKFTQITGYRAEEALGQTPRLLKSGETPAGEYQRMWAAITAGREWSGEFRNRRKDGSLYWETASISPIRDASGAITHFVGIKEDITELRLLESKFLRAQRLESIGSLASGIAHDLNNILTPIIMCASLLSSEETTEVRRELVQTIETSAQRAVGIVKQLLSFARGREGAKQPVQVGHLLRDMAKIARETFPRTIRVEEHCEGDLWAVSGDATQIHQVLLNLCVNARDAMPDGGKLTLRAENVTLDEHYSSMHKEASPGPFVRIEVRDTGTGILEENRERIFESFFTTKGEGQGTGLGLVTVRGIVRNHQGFVTFRSQFGRGTTFIIHLPALVQDARQEAEVLPSESLAQHGNGARVLVVDDEPAICDVTRLTLERHGYTVLQAGNGVEGLALFTHHRQDIRMVVTDFMMPLMDGVTFSRTLRAIAPDLPIVVSSGGFFGKGGSEALRVFEELGGIHIIHKPHTAGALLAAVGAILPPPSPLD